MRNFLSLSLAPLCLAGPAAEVGAQGVSAEAELRAALQGAAGGFSNGDAEKAVSQLACDMHLIHPLRGDVDREILADGIRPAYARPQPDKRVVATELDHLHVGGDRPSPTSPGARHRPNPTANGARSAAHPFP